MRSTCASLLVLGVLGCGQDPATQAANPSGSSSSSTGGDEGSSETALVIPLDVPPTLPDLPPETKSCEERGTAFGVIAGPVAVEIQPVIAPVSNVALTAADSGLLASYLSLESGADKFDLFGLQVRDDGRARGSPWAFAVASNTPSSATRDNRMLMMHCEDSEVGLRAFDATGGSLGPTLSPVGFPLCEGLPAGAWTQAGYLAAWHATPTEACPQGCLALGFGAENAVFNTRALGEVHIMTDPPALAMATRAVLVAATHINADGGNELLLSLVEPSGAPLFPLIIEPFPSAEPSGPQPRAPVGVGAEHTGRFVVFVGGRGQSLGRVRLSGIASVTDPFEDLVFDGEPQVLDAFGSRLKVGRRTGGYVVHGPATVQTDEGTRDGILAAMVDDRGTLHSYEFFDGAQDVAVATLDNRTFMLIGGEGLQFAELGCLL